MEQNITFKEMYDEWFETLKLHNSVKTLTLRRYQCCEPRIMKRFGNINLRDITHRDIQLFVNDISQSNNYYNPSIGLSPKSQRLHVTVISNVFQLAILEGYADMNPANGVKTTHLTKKDRDIYEIEEVQHILTLLEKEPLKYRVFFRLRSFQGLDEANYSALNGKTSALTTTQFLL